MEAAAVTAHFKTALGLLYAVALLLTGLPLPRPVHAVSNVVTNHGDFVGA